MTVGIKIHKRKRQGKTKEGEILKIKKENN